MDAYRSVEQISELKRAAGVRANYSQLGKGDYIGTLPTRVHGVSTFISETTTVAVAIQGQVDDDKYYVIGGDERLIANGRNCRPNELIVFAPGSESYAVTRCACSALQVTLPRALIDDYFSSNDPAVLEACRRSPLRFSIRANQSARFQSFVWALARTETRFDTHAREVEDFIISLLSRASDPGFETGRPAADYSREFKLATQYIRDNLGKPFSIVDLSAATNTPIRTLSRVFVRFTGKSPMTFVRICKLNAIRRDLLNGSDPRLTVSAAALKYHVNHLGRFSSLYRQFFGEYPKETMSRGVQGPSNGVKT